MTRLPKILALIILTVATLMLLSVDSFAFYLGVCTHMGRVGQPMQKDMESLKLAGANTFREDISWGPTEQVRGMYVIPPTIMEAINISVKSRITPLIVLSYGNPLYANGKKPTTAEDIAAFAKYAGSVARQLRGKVVLYEVWNEWNQQGEPSKTPESYLQLLKVVYREIKVADPKATVLAGVATMRGDWLVRLASLGALNYADGISMHAYVHCENNKSAEVLYKGVSDCIAAIEKAGGVHGVPIYITEIGWPTHIGKCGLPEQTAGQYVAQSILLLRTIPSVKGLWWYDLKDDGKDLTEMEQNFGLMGYDYSIKPQFKAFREVVPYILSGAKFELLTGSEYRFVGQGVVAREMLSIVTLKGGGVNTLAIWSKDGHSYTIPLKVRTIGKSAEVFHTGYGQRNIVNARSGAVTTIHITIDGFPTLVKDVEIVP